MHEKIKDIQNLVWKAYKDFKDSCSMRQYNKDVQAIVRKYADDKPMLNFAQNIIISWGPIINFLAEEKIKQKKSGGVI